MEIEKSIYVSSNKLNGNAKDFIGSSKKILDYGNENINIFRERNNYFDLFFEEE